MSPEVQSSAPEVSEEPELCLAVQHLRVHAPAGTLAEETGCLRLQFPAMLACSAPAGFGFRVFEMIRFRMEARAMAGEALDFTCLHIFFPYCSIP